MVACGSFACRSWTAQRSWGLRLRSYPCGTQGALDSGLAASSFEGFFSRFSVFLTFISDSLRQITHTV